MELFIALVALGVAIWQLKLQRDEIRTESRINSLLHVDQLLSNRISFLEKIIEDKKQWNQPWVHLAHTINTYLKPVRNNVNATLLEEVKDHLPKHITLMELRDSLGLSSTSNSKSSNSVPDLNKPHLSDHQFELQSSDQA